MTLSGTSTVYVSDKEFGEGGSAVAPTVYAYGAPVPAAAKIVSESSANVTGDSANIQAQIDPEFADTTYHFEYGTTSSYGVSVPLVEKDIGSTGGPLGVQSVSPVHLVGLQLDTTYHYRVIAENETGTTDGADATFTTQAVGGGLVLQDGRAWEMVSPLEKNNSLITGIDGFNRGGLPQAAEDGDSMVYASNGAFAHPTGAPVEAQYLAKRSTNGWSTVNITQPVVSDSYGVEGQGGPYKAFSADLSSGLLLNGGVFGGGAVRNPPLTKDAPEGYQNFYVQDLDTGGFQAVLTSTPSESSETFELELQGASPDLRHMVFSTEAALTPNAVDNGHSNLYEWSEGQLQLVNVLPGPGAVLGEEQAGRSGGLHAISNNGSVVFFTDQGNLYARVDGTSTIQIDAVSSGGTESGGGRFQIASGDGLRVFFTDNRRLTGDSTAKPGDVSDLYEYDLENGQLSDLTVQDPHGADVQRVLGASEDGSYVYFVANGVLAPGASLGHSCAVYISGGGARTCNLYVWHRTATDTRLSSPPSPRTKHGHPPSNQTIPGRLLEATIGAAMTRQSYGEGFCGWGGCGVHVRW